MNTNEPIRFLSDYMEGAHSEILRRFLETQMEQLSGYGGDKYTASAKEKIKKACRCDDAQVYFLTGGTQTNKFVIDVLLRPYEGVISAHSGHVNAHEAGAIESTGHKVLAVEGHEGKLRAEDIDRCVNAYNADASREHTVKPGMVYISFPTEYGTIYTKSELEAIGEVCRKHKIPLYCDGARLGYGLMSSSCDITLPDLARICDVFYIGGTKVGALCGEAIVFTRGNMPGHIVSLAKQHGALLAKGWLVGLQFDTLFEGDLYFEISKHAIALAERVKNALIQKGYRLFMDSPTNQQFVVMKNTQIAELSDRVQFETWEKYDDEHTVVRIATSWATPEENIDKLIELL